MIRRNISSGTDWEEKFGYSRLVQRGAFIEMSGTVAYENGAIVSPNDAGKQATFIFQKIELYLAKVNATMKDVVRTRIFLTDISTYEEVMASHSKFFKDICPACTLVEISGLINPELVVEIEVSAILETVE